VKRYLEAKQRFKKFQWIDAKVQKHDSDRRPESFRIDPDSIALGDVITDHVMRRSYLESSPHLISSLEALKERQLQFWREVLIPQGEDFHFFTSSKHVQTIRRIFVLENKF